MLIDTHSHLFLDEFKADIEQVIDRAKQNGISKIVNPNIDVQTIESLLKLSNKYQDYCYPLMGLHPESVKENYKTELEKIFLELKKRKYYGIGEIGIDLYWDKTHINEQKIAFELQIKKAIELNLPVVIHTRQAYKEVFEITDKYTDRGLKGIFHCFSGTFEDAQHILNYKTFKIGIGGVVTYKKSELPAIVEKLPISSIVLETDAPYLSPVPKRGKRNESSFIVYVAHTIANIKHLKFEQVAEATSQNAKDIFYF